MSSLPTPLPQPPPAAPELEAPERRRPSVAQPIFKRSEPPTRPAISALVTTFNEADNIGECLESLLWCDEIVVVDSFSADETVAIARRYDKVRVLQRQYLGAASQKNWAINKLRHDWILILDADERITPSLRQEIEQLLAAGPQPAAFAIPRRTYFLGRQIRYSGWQNDRVVRLFRRGSARYPNRRVHADMETREPAFRLEHTIDHYMVDDLGEYVHRLARYANWGAAQLWREGRKSGPFEVIVRPAWRFLRTYLLQRGFMEGLPGLTICLLHAHATFLKWSTLWSWHADRCRGLEPSLPAFDDDPAVWDWQSPSKAED